jgi:hypothetical protein
MKKVQHKGYREGKGNVVAESLRNFRPQQVKMKTRYTRKEKHKGRGF